MNIDAELDRVARLLKDGDQQEAGRLLTRLYSEGRAGTYEGCVKRVAHAESAIGAQFAICAGAFVEHGADPRVLSRALEGPLVRALQTALPFAAWADGVGEVEGPDAVDVGPRRIRRASIDVFARHSRANAHAVSAFFSLGTWYRPAVASWTRDLETLKDVQQRGRAQAAVTPLVGVGDGVQWLDMLLKTMFDQTLIVLVPELDEAWAVRVDGVTDVGQLVTLLSEPLEASLLRLGASGRASEPALAVAKGDADQQLDASYAASFHLYPWEALDPQTRMPVDGRFRWHAPGGSGDHSLPPDFLPGDLAPLDEDTRLVALVGPRTPGARFTRVIPAVRSFAALRAGIDAVRLSATDAVRWTQTALDAAAHRS